MEYCLGACLSSVQRGWHQCLKNTPKTPLERRAGPCSTQGFTSVGSEYGGVRTLDQLHGRVFLSRLYSARSPVRLILSSLIFLYSAGGEIDAKMTDNDVGLDRAADALVRTGHGVYGAPQIGRNFGIAHTAGEGRTVDVWQWEPVITTSMRLVSYPGAELLACSLQRPCGQSPAFSL